MQEHYWVVMFNLCVIEIYNEVDSARRASKFLE